VFQHIARADSMKIAPPIVVICAFWAMSQDVIDPPVELAHAAANLLATDIA
jgi:hypothetical protein